MKKIYKQYITQNRKNGKCLILGMDENYNAVKVEECISEQEANRKRQIFQKKSTIYYDMYNVLSQSINNFRARINSADQIVINFDDMLEKVLSEYKENTIRKRILISNIINESTESSRENLKAK